jgi:hypothetical protein
MTLCETRERLRKERAKDAVYRSGLVRLPITLSVTTTSVMGRIIYLPCEARRDESWLTVAVLETLSNLPCASPLLGDCLAVRTREAAVPIEALPNLDLLPL